MIFGPAEPECSYRSTYCGPLTGGSRHNLIADELEAANLKALIRSSTYCETGIVMYCYKWPHCPVRAALAVQVLSLQFSSVTVSESQGITAS